MFLQDGLLNLTDGSVIPVHAVDRQADHHSQWTGGVFQIAETRPWPIAENDEFELVMLDGGGARVRARRVRIPQIVDYEVLYEYATDAISPEP